MELDIIGIMLMMLAVLLVSITLILSIGTKAKLLLPERIQTIVEKFYSVIFGKAPYNMCEQYTGQQISMQEFEALLSAVYHGQCRDSHARITMSFSMTKEDITEISKLMDIAKKGDLIFYNISEPLGVGGIIVRGNPGYYPLKLYDQVEIWQEGKPDPDVIIKLSVQGCDPYDDDCDLMCSYQKICDPVCDNGQKYDIPCNMGCIDVNDNGVIDEEDARDRVNANKCNPDCYNDRPDPNRAYDPGCVGKKIKGDTTFGGICDPDSNGVKDGLCDSDCAKVNYICDPDCDGVVDEWNPTGLKDDDCYTCDKKCNGFCAPVCTKDDEDPDCEDGYDLGITECCGNNVCGSEENCVLCPKDCPAGGSCSDFDGVCCPGASDADDFGCSKKKNLQEKEECTCSNQCNETLSCNGGRCCPPNKFWNGTDCSDKTDVLIVALKTNMKNVYSDSQLTTLENKIQEYIGVLANDGLGGGFFYLDEDKTSDIIGGKVTNPSDWNNIDGVIDQLIPKLKAKYLLIVGGPRNFPMPRVSGWKTDTPYGDFDPKDNVPDIPVGRLPDPSGGDFDLLMNTFNTFIDVHNSGGLDLSLHIGRSMDSGLNTMECFSLYIWGKYCPDYPYCKIGVGDSSSAASGKDFFYLVTHGGPGPPQAYQGALNPSSVTGMDVKDSVWMMVPCYGGYIDYASTSQSIVLTFFRQGGAVFFGSTDSNCCVDYRPCTDRVDGGIGALYVRIARNFAVGTRIGDAFKNGKIKFKNEIGFGGNYEFYINHLYGDPSLKIRRMFAG